MKTRGVTLLVLVLAMSGCGRPTGDVSGRVRFEGKTVTSGTVLMVGGDGLPHYGAIREDGEYAITGVPPGPSLVTVSSHSPNSVTGKKGSSSDGTSDFSEAQKKNWFALPPRYADPDESGLRAEVRRGRNRHDIDLKK